VPGFTTGATTVIAGYYYSCALAAGAVKCWGFNLGAVSGSTTTPTTKPGLTSGVTALAGGIDHACAVSGNQVKCWGTNDFGQLGDGTQTDSVSVVTVQGFR
jgi:alpha-tubulin suppressor-like RCC1 family protein